MKTIRIESENPDWFGVWNKSEVESEMKDLDIKTDETSDEWAEYILDHVFDGELPQAVVDALVKYGGNTITVMNVRLPAGYAKIVMV